MPRLGLIIASALTLASLAALSGEAGMLPVRDLLLSIPMTEQLGGNGTRPIAHDDAFTFQTPNSPKEHQRPFSFGNRLFNTNWVEAPGSVKAFDGLGPMFNRVSCSGCHTKDGRGRPPENNQGPMDSMLFRISIPGKGENGGVRPHPVYGDQISERAILRVAPEGRAEISYTEVPGTYGDGEAFSLRKPQYAITDLKYGDLGKNIMISPRVAPAMIGLGLLQSVPEETLLALADPDDKDSDGISGRPNEVWDSVEKKKTLGRFGWKANQPNLRQQNAGAAVGDIGIATSLAGGQNCTTAQTDCASAINGGVPEMSDEFLEKLTLYTMTIAVPAQRNANVPAVKQGEELFRTMGCASCHMPTLQTKSVERIPELSNQTFHPFTDLLLHDMGEGLADNRPDFEATGHEWRTPPLWGLGLIPVANKHDLLLHDGRARGTAEAILWHGGEAEKSREVFRNAAKPERDALIAFLNSL
ncbi:MAG TPA: di-heme oxidoredictase family protein [Aestuariivirga sp.]|nr:di-heme oxidoredictase family protein [Aestuariivirga sp.]